MTRNLITLETEDAFLRWEEASMQIPEARAAAEDGRRAGAARALVRRLPPNARRTVARGKHRGAPRRGRSSRFDLVGAEGLEPSASAPQKQRSTRLSYAPISTQASVAG